MLNKQEFYESQIWPDWLKEIKQGNTATILIHGIMGSELCDYIRNDTIWIDWWIFDKIDNLEVEKLTPDGIIDSQNQCICARSTVNPPIVARPYQNILSQLKTPRFNYDWRESIPIESKRLERFLDIVLQDKQSISFITHSMGGCLLLWLLGTTDRFDRKIEKIIFCAPPFHGALKPSRVIENGNGTPADLIINNSILQHAAVTFPGLSDLLVAPYGLWITSLPNPGKEDIVLQHPVRSNINIYLPSSWTNKYNTGIFRNVLKFANDYYIRQCSMISNVIDRLKEKIHVIVGLNGKTDFAGVWREEYKQWTLHSVPPPPDGNISNGDGTVLFQSSFLPGLPLDRYWAYIPDDRKDTHGDLVDINEVINGIKDLMGNKTPKTLKRYDQFIDLIDWTHELTGAADPRFNQFLDYHERARMREKIPIAEWDSLLNPEGADALLFHAARNAALRVIQGENVKMEARRLGKDEDFLISHVKSLLMPVLFG